MSTKTEDLTFPYLRIGSEGIEAAMAYLGFPEWRRMQTATWTLESEVMVAALTAYDDLQATGFHTRGMVPKPKTGKQSQIDWAVFQSLRGLAERVLQARTPFAAEEKIREAWLLAEETQRLETQT